VPATISDRVREAEGGKTNIQTRLRVNGLGQTVEDWAGDGTLQKYDITHTLDASSVTGGWTIAWLEILSEEENVVEPSPNFGSFGDYYLQEAASTSDTLAPGDFVKTDVFTRVPIAEVDYNLTDATTDTGWPMLNESDVRTPSENDISIVAMGYIKPRSFHWSATQADDVPTSDYTVRPKRTMLANEAVLGRHTSRHLNNLEGVYSRPDVKSVGPQPVSSPNGTWSDLDQRWPTAYANGGANQSLGNLTMMLGRDTSEVTLYCWLQFCHVVTDNAIFAGRQLDLMRDYATLMDWDIVAKMRQASSGGSATFTSIATDTTTLEASPHWIAGYNSPVPILQQAFYSYYHQGDTGSDGYMWYEGSIIEERGDLQVMVPVQLSLTVDKDNADTFNSPVQINVEASPDTSTIEYELGTLQQDTDRIQCRLIMMAASEAGTP
jgi:hypothetical protein